ncbi:FtsX-like permease family protein [Amycolatopsis jiangsuensis]|uniref:Putative ABC transport system permease protein n=1 Tax=Amycolatopsis jiangsuensis TaxID=1181879 RepID=A0A840IV60_9PSEU|nr:FtsX-like permease family protein [Amycolatopsis jiangsuensis]MBB4685760.1 putative ABC transport system permease protein [Amycolatopsis jiangsuensis]
MLTLAVRLLRHHRATAVATGLVAVAGMALVVAMAALLGTGRSRGTAAADRDFLTQFPLILGGWVVAIVVFAMVSTISVTLDGRAGELGGLRLIGAGPRQVRVLVSAETFVICAVAALPGLGLGHLLGWSLLRGVRGAGLTDPATVYAPGFVLPVAGIVVVLGAGVLAGWIGSRGTARRSPVDAGEPARRGSRPVVRRRMVAAVLILAGLGSASAVLALPGDSIATTATTGPATVLTAIGLAVLAPELVASAHRLLRLAAPRDRGAGAHLATVNLAAAPERMRPAVTFLTLLVGVSAGTLAMQGIENRHVTADSTARVLASINYLVVVLIGVFMAIALTNNLVAAIGRRRGEFAVLALIGSTGRQVRGVLLRETAAATVTAVVTATVGAIGCVVPFAVVKTGSPAAAFAVGPYLLSMVFGAAVALLVTAFSGARAVRAVAVPA